MGSRESVMSGKEGTQSSTFCMLPFYAYLRQCWWKLSPVVKHRRYQTTLVNSEETWNNSKLQRIKKSPLNGEKSSRCNVCWHNEQSGIVSNRLFGKKTTSQCPQTPHGMMTISNNKPWVELKVSNFLTSNV